LACQLSLRNLKSGEKFNVNQESSQIITKGVNTFAAINRLFMFSLRNIVILPFLLLSSVIYAQKLSKSNRQLMANLKEHIGYLADDKLEGRRAGTNGEKLAMEYISKEFKEAGLTAKGTDGYYQAFNINEGKQLNEGSFFNINGTNLKPGTEFFVFPFSPNHSIESTPAIALQEESMPWFVDLAEPLEENKSNPHFDLIGYIKDNTKKASARGANLVILYNSSANNDNLEFNAKDRSELLSIPVIYLTKESANKYLTDKTATLDIKLKIDLGEKKRVGHNVIGFIDNGAPNTIILGAHFDHLGYGEDGNSMLRTGDKLIHNGADDNASGTAALIELGRLLKSSKAKKNNYLFIAFSGEELGLYGSKYFTENPTINLSSANYMINMDMIGRLNDSTKVVSIGGYGTSPSWSQVINPNYLKRTFEIHIDSSGTGPSDHTSFYRKDIPVLFFFTGQHKDYHRPGDDSEKINYLGEVSIINYISNNVIHELDKKGKLAFLKTREAQMGTTSFKVTLGIMPDYTFNGTGIRADGVTEGRPASNAGIKAGDVIIQLGEHAITSMETYMQALNKFKKGDKTTVKYKRGNETLKSDIQL
jgi:Zn-dependent M28 family amino/carboxypeptidase